MQKVLDLLEKHVQWLVLGLGAAFVLFMIYSYVITPPAHVEIGTSGMRTASDVDSTILETVGNELERMVGSPYGDPIPVQQFDQQFADTIGNVGVVHRDLANMIPGVPEGPSETPLPGLPEPGPEKAPLANVQLPVLPLANPYTHPASVIPGRSMVQMPVDPNAAAVNGAPAVPVFDENGNPMMGGVNGQPGGLQPPSDRDWATAFFVVHMKDLVVAWRNAGIVLPKVPQSAQETMFLGVVTEREEQTGIDEKGQPTWGNLTQVKPLSTVQLTPLPANNAPPAAQFLFSDWASKNQANILQPPFYVVTGGDPWHMPGETVAPVIDPAAAAAQPGEAPAMTPQEIAAQKRQQQQQEARERAQQAAQQREAEKRSKQPGTAGPGGPPGGPTRRTRPPGSGGSYQVADPRRPVARPTGPGGPPGYPTGYPPTGFPPGYPTGNVPGRPPMGANPNDPNAAKTAPDGAFIPGMVGVPGAGGAPGAAMNNIVIWVHDDTVQPGKTYRYRIKYILKNPVYNTKNLAAPAIAQQFAIPSQPCAWTEPVTIATRTQYFIVGAFPTRNTVKVAVYRWQEGRLNYKEFTVQPGDTIGANDGAIDYSTNQTVVDVREDTSVLVMDDKGQLKSRSFSADQKDPELKKLQQQANPAAAPAAAAVAPGAGGMNFPPMR